MLSLTLDTVIAGLTAPKHVILNKIEDVRDRAEVRRIYAELQETGRVEATLPLEQRVVRGLARKPKPEPDAAQRRSGPAFPATPTSSLPPPVAVEEPVVRRSAPPSLVDARPKTSVDAAGGRRDRARVRSVVRGRERRASTGDRKRRRAAAPDFLRRDDGVEQ